MKRYSNKKKIKEMSSDHLQTEIEYYDFSIVVKALMDAIEDTSYKNYVSNSTLRKLNDVYIELKNIEKRMM